MTIKEAILQTLDDLKIPSDRNEIYKHIKEKQYCQIEGKTPESSVNAQAGDFIRKSDSRVKRIKNEKGIFTYYLTKHENTIIPESDVVLTVDKPNAYKVPKNTYSERDLHKLLSSYLKSIDIFSKTIFHEESANNKDNHQKWVHPDMIGIKFLTLQTKVSQQLLKAISSVDTFKITSYELKKEINSDYELKKSYFQAVSNSSWANYGYLVAFEISGSLLDEMERLNQSFGIGIIELKANPYESKILFASKYKDLDFKTIDKLCHINQKFAQFIEQTEKYLTAEERYLNSIEKELESFCDDYFKNDSEIEKYCKEKYITLEEKLDS